jgi:hypothetical protein
VSIVVEGSKSREELVVGSVEVRRSSGQQFTLRRSCRQEVHLLVIMGYVEDLHAVEAEIAEAVERPDDVVRPGNVPKRMSHTATPPAA